jgi:hypothetical protein
VEVKRLLLHLMISQLEAKKQLLLMSNLLVVVEIREALMQVMMHKAMKFLLKEELIILIT